eukprot:CAMPEP_0176013942 /NCGR_PEP_ID=MMETSP0120_2-20121206/6566_1 /TAXON_ID=160619 /ORGANISM="Kryptoperidinium foliaceum, Strain CCMP 1326" /LENGTH=319 /DNA_ID=CAMNT_0017346865 /DNA_START=218 /DNA_END=1178 /DNA_ORIENTATION=+
MMAHPEEPHQMMHPEEPYHPPKILLKHMEMALRLTSEWNRRLLNGVNRFKFWRRKQATASSEEEQAYQPPPQEQQLSNYGSIPVNVHPSLRVPLTSGRKEEDELTLFHAKAPRAPSSEEKEAALRGVARWGPQLLPYLEHIVELLDISPDGVEIPLAMIYLDRACSVETPRSNGVPPCPFCTPRTVHRLSLASLLLARQAVKGSSQEEMQSWFEKVSSLGIPEVQLAQMVDWMRGALGDEGLMVTISQMKQWGHHWESIFHPNQQLEHHHPHGSVHPPQPQQPDYHQDPQLEHYQHHDATATPQSQYSAQQPQGPTYHQ